MGGGGGAGGIVITIRGPPPGLRIKRALRATQIRKIRPKTFKIALRVVPKISLKFP